MPNSNDPSTSNGSAGAEPWHGPGPYTDDLSRVRRRERLALRKDAGPPERFRPEHGRALRARAWATDRQGRFERRLEEVKADVERRERLRARMETAIVAGVGILGIGVAFLAGMWLPPVAAGMTAIGLVVLVLAGRSAAAEIARGRGPEAWDWQAGRHRLLGKPAAKVQKADAPPPTDPRR